MLAARLQSSPAVSLQVGCSSGIKFAHLVGQFLTHLLSWLACVGHVEPQVKTMATKRPLARVLAPAPTQTPGQA